MPRPTAVERKQKAQEYVNAIDTLRKTESLSVEQAAKKAGKTVSGYYNNKRIASGAGNKKTKVTRKRRSNLPVVTGVVTGKTGGFTEFPESLRRTGSGKMLLAVAVGDGQEVTRALENTLNKFFQ